MVWTVEGHDCKENSWTKNNKIWFLSGMRDFPLWGRWRVLIVLVVDVYKTVWICMFNKKNRTLMARGCLELYFEKKHTAWPGRGDDIRWRFAPVLRPSCCVPPPNPRAAFAARLPSAPALWKSWHKLEEIWGLSIPKSWWLIIIYPIYPH